MTFSRNLAVILASSGLLAPFARGGTVNYALDKPATASGSFAGAGFSIAKGNDGNLYSTAWNGGGWAAWWQVDLLASLPIDRIDVFSMDGPGYHTTFQLSSSTNGSDWASIGLQTTASGLTWTRSFSTGGAEMRYIRYTTIGDYGSDWATLGELQAYGPDPGLGQAPEPATLALIAAGLAAVGLARRFRR